MCKDQPELPEQLYRELHALASLQMRGQRPDHTLQPTALVNEAYLRLAHYGESLWADKGQFRALAATCIRNILVEHARRRNSLKRGGGIGRVTLHDQEERDGGALASIELQEMLDTLVELEQHDRNMARLIELRYFGGLTLAESAEQLKIPVSTAQKRMRYALAWMRVRLDSTNET